MTCRRGRREDGAIPIVVVGGSVVAGFLGLAWVGNEWAQSLLREAGGELTVFVLRSAFWAIDLVALQTSTAAVDRDWWTPVLEGPAMPLYTLALLVMVAALLAETVGGVVTGNTTRIVQAIFRALGAGLLATVGATILLLAGDALSGVGQTALAASGATADAPLVPLQEVLMESAEGHETGAELFVAAMAGVVIVVAGVTIYFILAMRPMLLALLIVWLPVAHALSVWTPLRRVQLRSWAVALAVLLADSAVLTTFAVANTVMGQPEGVDRLLFGTFGLAVAAVAPAALARVVGTPELQTPVQALRHGTRAATVGAGAVVARSALRSWGRARDGRRSATLAAQPLGAAGGARGPGGGTGPPIPGGLPVGGSATTAAARPADAAAAGGSLGGRPGTAAAPSGGPPSLQSTLTRRT